MALKRAKGIDKQYGRIAMVVGGLILAVLGLVLNAIISIPLMLLGVLIPMLAPVVGMVSLILSFYLSSLVAIFVVTGWLNKNKRIGGF